MNISQQTFYRLIRENNELRTLVEQNKVKRGNGFRYDTPVLEWLLEYYGKEANTSPIEAADAESNTKALQGEIEALKGRLEALQAQLEAKEQERKQLLTQNAQLILLLGQEKQEKQALLTTAHRQTFGERLRGIFHKGEKQP